MTHDLRAKLAAANRLAEGATTPGERDAAEAAIKRLKKAMKRTGQDRPFEAPPVTASAQQAACRHQWIKVDQSGARCASCGLHCTTAESATTFAYTGTPEGFGQAWDEFLYGRRREAPKRPGPTKFPKADNAAYPKAYSRK